VASDGEKTTRQARNTTEYVSIRYGPLTWAISYQLGQLFWSINAAACYIRWTRQLRYAASHQDTHNNTGARRGTGNKRSVPSLRSGNVVPN
jgi:hypothetical protein